MWGKTPPRVGTPPPPSEISELINHNVFSCGYKQDTLGSTAKQTGTTPWYEIDCKYTAL